jgi:2-polyprenyl-6-hydroxyphenyl methylase/3-demethylubiquinone-9 3-methyltransferase
MAMFAPSLAAAYINGVAASLNPWAHPSIMTVQSASLDSSVDAAEVAKFSALAAQWWDPRGKFAPLHKFNPVRLDFIRREAAARFGREGLRPFTGLSLLDIGCGGGLLSEPMARLGFAVTGADASERNIGTAKAHAAQSGLEIDYRATTAESLAAEGLAFDVVLNMEVIEHVADVGSYLPACARLVKPGGITIVATMNKTLKSLALAKIGAEYVLGWLPRGTHDWNRFITPAELCAKLEESGLTTLKKQGVSFDPLIWDWKLSSDVDVNYMIVAWRKA